MGENMTYEEQLRRRFAKFIEERWTMNDHSLKEIRCVYAILGYDVINKTRDVLYIGSTTKLCSRYKSHKVPEKVQALGLINVLFYLPMDRGFYDYEIKLIGRLNPFFNKQHKSNGQRSAV